MSWGFTVGWRRNFSGTCAMRFAAVSFVPRTPDRGGAGAEQRGAERWAFCELSENICATESWSARDWCGAARRGALSFRGVCLLYHEYWRNRDAAVLARFLCQRAKVAEKVVTFLSFTFRQICRKKGNKKYLMKKCRERDYSVTALGLFGVSSWPSC